MSSGAKVALVVFIIAVLVTVAILLYRRAKMRAMSNGVGALLPIANKRMDSPVVKPDNGPLVAIMPELAA